MTAWGDGLAAIQNEQNDLCDICKSALKHCRVCVDHDHETGIVRGLLCSACNTQEGLSDDLRFRIYRADPPARRCGVELQYARPAPPRPTAAEMRKGAEVFAAYLRSGAS